MLVEIKCDIFRKEVLTFHSGLNIVLGDEKATNSIGKSTLLMIIDYIFGGDTYLTHNSDVVKEIRHHDICFTFQFEKKYRFKRNTENNENLYECDENYEVIESMDLDIYREFLKEKYELLNFNSSFRNLISTYSRVWGKGNDDITKPLKTYKNDSKETKGIFNLIRLFNRYKIIEKIDAEIKVLNSSKTILNGVFNKDYIHKITKREYEKNKKQVESINSEIEKIKDNILKYTINANEIIDEELLNLKKQKNTFLVEKNKYKNQLMRIERNLESKTNLSPRHLKKIEEFFPNVNIEKINKIESFHNKVSKILKSEIKKNKEKIEMDLSFIDNQIQEVDIKIDSIVSKKDNPRVIVDKIHDLTVSLKDLDIENTFYEEKVSVSDSLTEKKNSLKEEVLKILKKLNENINIEIEQVNKILHSEKRRPPKLTLEDNKYSYETINNTGTGKAYINLLIFDVSIFGLTKLPIIIHDSFLFKNIEDVTIEKLISKYNDFDKQIFISIDKIDSLNNETKNIIENKHVIKLDNKNILFIKDWRDNE
ncbi:DUF2326 domain-containing protein [Malaciobacter marinus]|uniref:DUF2326 domain-containing protein n=1 Tax=Malaciobacter marinus TaxID=505249 RepID=UPI003AFF94F8